MSNEIFQDYFGFRKKKPLSFVADILIHQEHCRSAGIECRIQFPAGSENHKQFILVTEFFIRNLTLQQEFAISEISLSRIIQQSDIFFFEKHFG